MENYKLLPLTEEERKFATENHKYIYSFLRRHNYDTEEFYDVVVFGFLKAVQVYLRKPHIKEKYDFPFVNWAYCRVEMQLYFKRQRAKMRVPPNDIILYIEDGIGYSAKNYGYQRSFENEVAAAETLDRLKSSLPELQRKIIDLKLEGYSNSEIFTALGMKQSTYYYNLNKLKGCFKKAIA